MISHSRASVPVFIKASMFQAYLADEGYTMNNRRMAKPTKKSDGDNWKIKKLKDWLTIIITQFW